MTDVLYQNLADDTFGLLPSAVAELLPEISFVAGADLTEWGFAAYTIVPQPVLNPNEAAVEVAPIDGVQQWSSITLPTERVSLPKSLVVSRVQAAGKMPAVFQVLMRQPIAFAQWFSPDWPNVFADDFGLLQILTAVGCTSEEIATITAPA